MNSRRTFVLIHGGWHGAWCWQRLVPLLDHAGARVVAPDLPSMGADRTDPATITLAGWTRFVADIVRQQADPVVLVGHSRAGAIISQVAEVLPERVRRLVYLSAYLLPSGRSVADEARSDAGSLIPANMVPTLNAMTATLVPGIVGEAFYGSCNAEDRALASAQLSPEPLKPLVTAVKVTTERFGSVARAYIECTQDRTISLAAQRSMQHTLPCAPVLTLDSDHSPFWSRPRELAELLGRL